jgi:excisionase family DNA binding protein
VAKAKPKQAKRPARAVLKAAPANEQLASLRRTPDAPVRARTVAELCGVDLKTVHQWAASGLIAHFRTPGRHLRFRSDDVLHFLEQAGYPRAQRGTPHVLALVSPAARAQASALGPVKITWCTDPYQALVRASHLEVRRIVVELERLGSVALKPYLAALRLAGPGTPVYLFGTGTKPRVSGVFNVARLEDALGAA